VKLSVVIPARDERGLVESTLSDLRDTLDEEGIPFEIVVVDDGSRDGTFAILERIAREDDRVIPLRSPYAGGFGLAVRAGLERFSGDAVAVMMADGSDSPRDLVIYYRTLERGYDCAFGSRFVPGGTARDYPLLKLALNRIVNQGIRVLFGHGYNDTTNAFKAYRREVIENVQPLLSNHFNLTVELPLKAVIRGHSYAIVPVSWTNRSTGRSKFALQEMGSRYLFVTLYALLEHHLSRGDYRLPDARRSRWPAGRPGER
jgi:dolichol-phosphate mannosyltransferase